MPAYSEERKLENNNLQHPLQPLISDQTGRLRFKANAIVTHLLDQGPFDMNSLAIMDFTVEDREQFAQLIGYSLDGFGELGYVRDETYDAAERMVNPEASKEPSEPQVVKSAPMAVYHYSALVSKQFHGPAHHDGVITIPVISGGDDYIAARALIARNVGAEAHDTVEISSLSFVGETVAAKEGNFIGPAGDNGEVINWPQRKVVITATHQTVGDNRFWPMLVDAIKECGEKDPMGCEEDFTASNGVRVRFSWPRLRVVG